ncbi:lytic murein transglycosylase [Natronospira bacteriovora]|uniref:Lytic murein transglycosylase n=1 Tax=Natronospira bacteriovora TaxID=3069753 RepID=A0ABU0W7T3_9GAMM|nr:lytic murein transglycosylase [Natronospira sp. AB-CW4]MDQ2070069.1 lytic murein transglycosylase [Natronospira sp. AB-CW4]
MTIATAARMPLLRRITLAPMLLLAIAAGKAGAMDDHAFASCVDGIAQKARAQGISEPVIRDSLGAARFNERVIELDRRQPEFTTTFADYLNRRVTEQRVARGRALLEEHRELLDSVAREYGVPAQYLVAFWGLETNYGSYFGRMSVIDSLATLACDPRRSDYFRGELISALRIIDEGSINPRQMEGSWAGAMGHVQFMPSVFLRYAVDHDGSGRRDLWGSLPDAMASAANFLQGIGWETGWRWGREVVLPDSFDYSLAGRENARPLAEWSRMGIRRPDGYPPGDADIDAALLIPAGHQGPAFLVYGNFKVIMRWNRSEYYALSVGHLADRIAGGSGLHNPPPQDAPRLSRDQVKTLQSALNERGFDSGAVDGILGPNTRRALARFQRDRDLVPDGFPGPDVLKRLGVDINDS